MTKVEKVARAICEAEKMNPDDPLGGWVHWTAAAEAAIAVMTPRRRKVTTIERGTVTRSKSGKLRYRSRFKIEAR